jgi:hypothetical protein
MSWVTWVVVAFTIVNILFTFLLFLVMGKLTIVQKALQHATLEGLKQVDIEINRDRLRIFTLEQFLVKTFGLEELIKQRKQAGAPPPEEDEFKN